MATSFKNEVAEQCQDGFLSLAKIRKIYERSGIVLSQKL